MNSWNKKFVNTFKLYQMWLAAGRWAQSLYRKRSIWLVHSIIPIINSNNFFQKKRKSKYINKKQMRQSKLMRTKAEPSELKKRRRAKYILTFILRVNLLRKVLCLIASRTSQILENKWYKKDIYKSLRKRN